MPSVIVEAVTVAETLELSYVKELEFNCVVDIPLSESVQDNSSISVPLISNVGPAPKEQLGAVLSILTAIDDSSEVIPFISTALTYTVSFIAEIYVVEASFEVAVKSVQFPEPTFTWYLLIPGPGLATLNPKKSKINLYD